MVNARYLHGIMDLALVILAAGLSTRYGRAKQLEAVGPSGEALLDYAIYDAVRAGFSRAVLIIRQELEHAFRDHIGRWFQGTVEVSYVFQELEALPAGFQVPRGRRKPWGTAHAILTAQPRISGPFAVCNADDFYGASSYRLLYDQLCHIGTTDEVVFALVSYTLRDTLSPSGGVSRGICTYDEEGLLTSAAEVRQIKAVGDRISGVTAAGEPCLLTGNETISTNLWGFTPAVFPIIEREFTAFLRRSGGDPDAEFLIGAALTEQVAKKQVRIKVLPSPDEWLGMTHPEDTQHVTERIREFVRQGIYPENLAAGLRALPGSP